jgi:aminoglycoside phosphotransferase (APT) family kinase protein
MPSIAAITSRPFLDYISAAIGIECLGYTHPPKETFGRENENYFLGIQTKDGPIELVLRCEPKEMRPSREGYQEDYIAKEFHILRELQNLELGYRTSKVWGLTSGGLLETNYFLMEKLEGSVLHWNFQPNYTRKN